MVPDPPRPVTTGTIRRHLVRGRRVLPRQRSTCASPSLEPASNRAAAPWGPHGGLCHVPTGGHSPGVTCSPGTSDEGSSRGMPRRAGAPCAARRGIRLDGPETPAALVLRHRPSPRGLCTCDSCDLVGLPGPPSGHAFVGEGPHAACADARRVDFPMPRRAFYACLAAGGANRRHGTVPGRASWTSAISTYGQRTNVPVLRPELPPEDDPSG